jgi:hypothetical protein
LVPFGQVVSEKIKFEKVNGRTTGELKNDEKRAITPRRVIRFTSKLQGMWILTS